ncbi:uncharacterized protein LOC121386496 [Gigantopelta aegis]|uniref:uncharacterized protein LOC121386496 n=1 Tax=Gigantopelta aegis TaxID=1735272 RepID=UPI001B88D66A|nr:uncharacterized protein LOC121386496 [Gigantopelta aegis]
MVSVIPFQSVRAPADLAFDPIENMVYWSDYWYQTINRGHLNGSNQEVIFSNVNVLPTNLAIDWYSRLLYFTDYNSGSIQVISLKNWTTKTLIKQWDISVTDIALHPARGLLFFTAQIKTYITKTTNTSEMTSQSTTTGAVYAAYMDGTNASPIAWGLAKPTGITVSDECVYWADGGVNTIERVTVGDWNYTLLLQLPLTEDNEPVDVAVARDHVYWTERGARVVKRMSLKQDGAATEDYGYPRFFKLLGLDVMNERHSVNAGNSSCSGDDSGCYHMCLPTPDGAVCTCPAEYSFGPHCYTSTRKSTHRRKFMTANFCIIPDVQNGTAVDVKSGSFVSPGFRVRIVCDVGFRVTSQWNWVPHQKGVSMARTLGELECMEGGHWNMEVYCQWDMNYIINGTWSHGFVILRESSQFLVHPEIKLLDVICIGGGGGGFDHRLVQFKVADKAGDGGNTTFGGYVRSGGGRGGTLKQGGAGGFGYTLYGGDGGDSNRCHGGGAAGQTRDHGFCILASTTCLFCGAGAAPQNCSTCSRVKDEPRPNADDRFNHEEHKTDEWTKEKIERQEAGLVDHTSELANYPGMPKNPRPVADDGDFSEEERTKNQRYRQKDRNDTTYSELIDYPRTKNNLQTAAEQNTNPEKNNTDRQTDKLTDEQDVESVDHMSKLSKLAYSYTYQEKQLRRYPKKRSLSKKTKKKRTNGADSLKKPKQRKKSDRVVKPKDIRGVNTGVYKKYGWRYYNADAERKSGIDVQRNQKLVGSQRKSSVDVPGNHKVDSKRKSAGDTQRNQKLDSQRKSTVDAQENQKKVGSQIKFAADTQRNQKVEGSRRKSATVAQRNQKEVGSKRKSAVGAEGNRKVVDVDRNRKIIGAKRKSGVDAQGNDKIVGSHRESAMDAKKNHKMGVQRNHKVVGVQRDYGGSSKKKYEVGSRKSYKVGTLKQHITADALNKENVRPVSSGLRGGCSGPWAMRSDGLKAGNYGGGATGRNGGWGGGGGGFSRLHVDVGPGEIIQVEVGKGGLPSVGSAGNGIVVVSWGWSIETFLGGDESWEDYIHSCIEYV